MKKKMWMIIAFVCLLLGLVAAISSANRPAPGNEIPDLLNRVEKALGAEWNKQSVTEVSEMAYSDGEGNTIVYYVCATAYYEADATGQTGLNTDAIAAVISLEEAESCRECSVSGLPAAIWQKDGRAYLCWTVTPEFSCVLEYDPAVEREEDMLRMAESIPLNKAKVAKP